MPLDVTTDPVEIAAILGQAIDADPVRATVLGSIRGGLADADGPWCARSSTALAARSETGYPVALSEGWLDDGDIADLVGALARLPGLVGLSGPGRIVDDIASALADRTPGERFRASTRTDMRLYRLDELTEPVGVPGRARVAGTDDLARVTSWLDAFAAEAHDFGIGDPARTARRMLGEGGVFLWDDGGAPVSLAWRRQPAGGSARIGPVYTPPEHRGHGYGSAVTAAATRDILDAGAIPVLFTDLANPTSNKIYQRLGYYPVEERTQIRFDVLA